MLKFFIMVTLLDIARPTRFIPDSESAIIWLVVSVVVLAVCGFCIYKFRKVQ